MQIWTSEACNKGISKAIIGISLRFGQLIEDGVYMYRTATTVAQLGVLIDCKSRVFSLCRNCVLFFRLVFCNGTLCGLGGIHLNWAVSVF